MSTDPEIERMAKAMRAAWYACPSCPGEIYAAELRAMAHAARSALRASASVEDGTP